MICGGGGVAPIGRVLPYNGILGKLIKMEVVQEHPKGEELPDVLDGDGRGGVDLGNPIIVFEGLAHLLIFPHGGLEN